MSFTLRQVQPLLTKPELELFQASRATAVKALTARQLTARITRARALRDKYRDTYRRQTVATRTGPAGARASKGGENARTDVKAEVLADVLSRFEAQLAKVESAAPPVRAHNAPGAPATRTNPKAAQRSRRSTGNAAPGDRADLAMRGATATGKRQVARKDRAAQDLGEAVVSARAAKSTRGPTTPARAPVKKTAANSAPAVSAGKLVMQVRQAVARKQATEAVAGAPTSRRGMRTEVGGSPSANAQGAVPTNMPALAQRLNPLKAEPVNKKIHASARSRQKAATAKRDAR